MSSIRVKVEHVLGAVKGQLKFKRTRYRGLRKQIAKFRIMFALMILILADSLILCTARQEMGHFSQADSHQRMALLFAYYAALP